MTTSGIKTSEFWLSMVAIIAASVVLVTGDIDADKWILIVTGATGAYNLSRGLAKVGPATPTPTTTTAPDPGP